MASRSKAKIHSEFRARTRLIIRAPEGSDPRSLLMQELVQELELKHNMGVHQEWIIESLLDRMSREKAAGIGVGAGLGYSAPAQRMAVVESQQDDKPASSAPSAAPIPAQHPEPDSIKDLVVESVAEPEQASPATSKLPRSFSSVMG